MPSLCPACNSKDNPVTWVFGTGVAAGLAKRRGPLEEMLKKVSIVKTSKTPKERIFFFIGNSS